MLKQQAWKRKTEEWREGNRRSEGSRMGQTAEEWNLTGSSVLVIRNVLQSVQIIGVRILSFHSLGRKGVLPRITHTCSLVLQVFHAI